MILDKLDVITRDVPSATALCRDVLGLSPTVAEERYVGREAATRRSPRHVEIRLAERTWDVMEGVNR